MKQTHSIWKLALAALLACGLCGNALADDIGVLQAGQNPFTKSFLGEQSFADIVTFSLPDGADRFSSVVTGLNLPDFNINTVLGAAQFFDASFTPVSGSDAFLFTALNVPAGTYHLGITGTTTGAGGGYVGSFDVTPVPEPGTWAMLLAGLGVVALGARRRKS